MGFCVLEACEPAAAPEPEEWGGDRDEHKGDGEGVTEAPVEFGHDAEIHAVNTGDEGGHNTDGTGDGEDLHTVILFDIDEA